MGAVCDLESHFRPRGASAFFVVFRVLLRDARFGPQSQRSAVVFSCAMMQSVGFLEPEWTKLNKIQIQMFWMMIIIIVILLLLLMLMILMLMILMLMLMLILMMVRLMLMLAAKKPFPFPCIFVSALQIHVSRFLTPPSRPDEVQGFFFILFSPENTRICHVSLPTCISSTARRFAEAPLCVLMRRSKSGVAPPFLCPRSGILAEGRFKACRERTWTTWRALASPRFEMCSGSLWRGFLCWWQLSPCVDNCWDLSWKAVHLCICQTVPLSRKFHHSATFGCHFDVGLGSFWFVFFSCANVRQWQTTSQCNEDSLDVWRLCDGPNLPGTPFRILWSSNPLFISQFRMYGNIRWNLDE